LPQVRIMMKARRSVVATPGAGQQFTPGELAGCFKDYLERGPMFVRGDGTGVAIYELGEGAVLVVAEDAEGGLTLSMPQELEWN